jgi:biopolymer transport protein ExbD
MNHTKRPIKRRFSGLPHFGLMAVIVFFLFVVPLWVLDSQRPHARGLTVSLIRMGTPLVSSDLLPEPLVVRIRRDLGGSVRLFFNSEESPHDAFQARLRQELDRRPPSWPVYVSGDVDLDWQQVVNIIDSIQGEYARVILLTAIYEESLSKTGTRPSRNAHRTR